VLLNYTKSGRPFNNLFHVAPVKDDTGVAWFVGIQKEVSDDFVQSLTVTDRPLALAAADQPFALPGERPATCTAAQEVARKAESLASLLASGAHRGGPDGVRAMPGQPCTADSVPAALLRALCSIQQSFCLSDARLPDCPIVHCSAAFVKMTGYAPHEILGRNCRFLQGPDTDSQAVAQLREGVRACKAVTVCLLNYRKDGSQFWNSVHVAPVRDASGKAVLFIGVQLDVTAERAGEAAAEAEATDSTDIAQLSAVGAVRVAVRGLNGPSLTRHT